MAFHLGQETLQRPLEFIGKLDEHHAKVVFIVFDKVFDNFSMLYCINFNSCKCGWEFFCDRGPGCRHLEFANKTLNVMLNEFAHKF